MTCMQSNWEIEFVSSPDVIPSGWLGSKHQVTTTCKRSLWNGPVCCSYFLDSFCRRVDSVQRPNCAGNRNQPFCRTILEARIRNCLVLRLSVLRLSVQSTSDVTQIKMSGRGDLTSRWERQNRRQDLPVYTLPLISVSYVNVVVVFWPLHLSRAGILGSFTWVLGQATAAARAALPIPNSACGIFVCPNKAMTADAWDLLRAHRC